jgi:UDP-4-amino-4,6-dideoxy-N-acetyl-beta-L-altrosamine N-acetyltransferase
MDAEVLPRARSAETSLALRAMRADDRDLVRQWRNAPHVARYMYTDQEISAEAHAQWFARALADPARRYWIIVADGADIGLANLYDIQTVHRRCFWAFYIGAPEIRGKGIGSFVEYAVLSYVFDRRGFNKLCCEVLAENEPVWRMHEKYGFVIEGRYRRHICKTGIFHDVIALAMLAEDWARLKSAMRQKLRERGLALDV